MSFRKSYRLELESEKQRQCQPNAHSIRRWLICLSNEDYAGSESRDDSLDHY